MLLSSRIVQRLEPVSKVSGTTLNGPDLGSVSNGIGGNLVNGALALQGLDEGLVDGLGQHLGHLSTCKDILAKDLGNGLHLAILLRENDVTRASGKGLYDGIDTSLMSHSVKLREKNKENREEERKQEQDLSKWFMEYKEQEQECEKAGMGRCH